MCTLPGAVNDAQAPPCSKLWQTAIGIALDRHSPKALVREGHRLGESLPRFAQFKARVVGSYLFHQNFISPIDFLESNLDIATVR